MAQKAAISLLLLAVVVARSIEGAGLLVRLIEGLSSLVLLLHKLIKGWSTLMLGYELPASHGCATTAAPGIINLLLHPCVPFTRH